MAFHFQMEFHKQNSSRASKNQIMQHSIEFDTSITKALVVLIIENQYLIVILTPQTIRFYLFLGFLIIKKNEISK